jgi:hypothetical protein
MAIDANAICDCILATHPEFDGHTEGDHERERCTGRWTSEPPCGGCLNCLAAQAYYYADLAKREAGAN